MRAVWATALCAALSGCQMLGTETQVGVSSNDMTFGEVDFVLETEDGSTIQGVPFLAVGQGTLPEQYGDDVSYQRVSLGQKVRLPLRLAKGRVVVYVEAGGMVSYYESEAIGTPFEPEVVAGGACSSTSATTGRSTSARAPASPWGTATARRSPSTRPTGRSRSSSSACARTSREA